MTTPPKKSKKSTAVGIVRTTEVLSAKKLAIRLGIGDRAVAAMFRDGLRYRVIWKTKYVSGRNFRRYIEQGNQPCQDEAA